MKARASKEDAIKAMADLVWISDALPTEVRQKVSGHLLSLEKFLEAAKGRMPTQAAIDRDRNRKRRSNTYTECGSCGQYHRTDYAGDCRNDSERFAEVPEGGVKV